MVFLLLLFCAVVLGQDQCTAKNGKCRAVQAGDKGCEDGVWQRGLCPGVARCCILSKPASSGNNDAAPLVSNPVVPPPPPVSSSGTVYTIKQNPIIIALTAAGMTMPKVVEKFTKKTAEVVLDNIGTNIGQVSMEDAGDISGSSSINAKIAVNVPKDAKEPDGQKRLGTFVPRGNGAGNPITEIAAFNLGLIFGQPELVRPAVRAEMGAVASLQFKRNWESFLAKRPSLRRNQLKMDNANRVFGGISSSGGHLYGAMKDKKQDCFELSSMCCGQKTPCQTHPIQQLLKASARQPQAGKTLLLNSKPKPLSGDELVLCREFSIVMTIDAILGQWDRYTGTCGNLMYRVDDNNMGHIYSTDNGGANLAGTPAKPSSWTQNHLKFLERFDRTTINVLRDLSNFLSGKSKTFLGYADALQFTEDFGLYGTQYAPWTYARTAGKLDGFRINLLTGVNEVLKRCDALIAQYGEAKVFLPEPAGAAPAPRVVDPGACMQDCITSGDQVKLAQQKVGITASGSWDNSSLAALNAHQRQHNHPVTTCLNDCAIRYLN